MAKKTDQFNPAFKDIQGLAKIVKPKLGQNLPAPMSPPKGPQVSEEEYYFQQAMAGVKPLVDQHEKSITIPGTDIRPPHPAPDDTRQGLIHLKMLVQGDLEMDISFTDEYIEGAVPGLSPKIMRNLKRGKFPVRGHLDLHGLTQQDAEVKVREFLVQSHRQGLRCVLIVHGRGLNSPDSFPVLKERLPVWLNRGPTRKIVLAFATAKPYDGGTGAIYVLLRSR